MDGFIPESADALHMEELTAAACGTFAIQSHCARKCPGVSFSLPGDSCGAIDPEIEDPAEEDQMPAGAEWML